MKIYQVGGSVRDMLRGEQPQDYDYVVVGSDINEMLALGFIQVGKDFPVFLHPETKEEYALARKEIKTGPRHTDFEFVFDASVSLIDDLERRDFTCNAIAYDQESQIFIDPFNGQQDISNHILRHVNTEHFQEDPLRILRLCRFSAQLGYHTAPQTLVLVTQMTQAGMLDHLTPERVWKELEKALRFSTFPEFVRTARSCGALGVILPEVERLWNTPERTDYHPEGNSGEHTLLTLQQATSASSLVRFALLLHDIGKTITPAEILPSHHFHEINGLELIENICHRLHAPNSYRDFALMASKNHMKLCKVFEMRIGSLVDFCEEVSRLGTTNMDNFIEVCRADMYGCQRVIMAEEEALFATNVTKLQQVSQLLQPIRATDMPNYEKLPKDENFGKLYREYRIRRVQRSLAQQKQSSSSN